MPHKLCFQKINVCLIKTPFSTSLAQFNCKALFASWFYLNVSLFSIRQQVHLRLMSWKKYYTELNFACCSQSLKLLNIFSFTWLWTPCTWKPRSDSENWEAASRLYNACFVIIKTKQKLHQFILKLRNHTNKKSAAKKINKTCFVQIHIQTIKKITTKGADTDFI